MSEKMFQFIELEDEIGHLQKLFSAKYKDFVDNYKDGAIFYYKKSQIKTDSTKNQNFLIEYNKLRKIEKELVQKKEELVSMIPKELKKNNTTVPKPFDFNQVYKDEYFEELWLEIVNMRIQVIKGSLNSNAKQCKCNLKE